MTDQETIDDALRITAGLVSSLPNSTTKEDLHDLLRLCAESGTPQEIAGERDLHAFKLVRWTERTRMDPSKESL